MSTSEWCTEPPTFTFARSNFQDWLRVLVHRRSPPLPPLPWSLAEPYIRIPRHADLSYLSLPLALYPRPVPLLFLHREDAILSTDHAFTAYRERSARRSRSETWRVSLLLIFTATWGGEGERQGRKRSKYRGSRATAAYSPETRRPVVLFVAEVRPTPDTSPRGKSRWVASTTVHLLFHLVGRTSVTVDVPRRASVHRKKSAALGWNVITARLALRTS